MKKMKYTYVYLSVGDYRYALYSNILGKYQKWIVSYMSVPKMYPAPDISNVSEPPTWTRIILASFLLLPRLTSMLATWGCRAKEHRTC